MTRLFVRAVAIFLAPCLLLDLTLRTRGRETGSSIATFQQLNPEHRFEHEALASVNPFYRVLPRWLSGRNPVRVRLPVQSLAAASNSFAEASIWMQGLRELPLRLGQDIHLLARRVRQLTAGRSNVWRLFGHFTILASIAAISATSPVSLAALFNPLSGDDGDFGYIPYSERRGTPAQWVRENVENARLLRGRGHVNEALEILTALLYGDRGGEWPGFERRGVEATADAELIMSGLRSEVEALYWKCRLIVSAFSGLDDIAKPHGVDQPIRLAGALWSGFFALRHEANKANAEGMAKADEFEVYFRYLEHELSALLEAAGQHRDYVSERFSVAFTALADKLHGSTEFPDNLSARARAASRRMSLGRTDDVFRLMKEYFDAAFRERSPITIRHILASPMDRMLLLPDYETNEMKRRRMLQILIWAFSDDEWTAGDNQAWVLDLLADLYDGQWSQVLEHLDSVRVPEEWNMETWERMAFIDRKGRMIDAIDRKIQGPPLHEISAVHLLEPGHALTLPAQISIVLQLGQTRPKPMRVVLHTSPDGLFAEQDGSLVPIRPSETVAFPLEEAAASVTLDETGAWVTIRAAEAGLAIGLLDPQDGRPVTVSPDVLKDNANWAETILDQWKAVKNKRGHSKDPHTDLYLLQLDKYRRVVREVRLDLGEIPEGRQLTADQLVARGVVPARVPVSPGDLFIGFSWTHAPSYRLDSPTVETWVPARRDNAPGYTLLRTKHSGSWLGQRTFLELAYRLLADEQRRWFGGPETTMQSIFGSLLVATLGRQFLFPELAVSPYYVAVIPAALVAAVALTWRMSTVSKPRSRVLQRMA